MSDFNLPDGWVEVQWNEITQSDGFRRGPFGGNLKKEFFVKEGFAVYEQYAPINDDCSQFRYFISKEKYLELSGFRVESGDFLISCSGTMGKITHVPVGAPAGVINQALLRIRVFEKHIDSNYFIKLFRSPEFQEKVLTKSGGGAIQNLAAVAELKQILLPLAPLAEQQQIAQKLDELLAQVDTLKTRLDAIPKILKRFRQSVLAAAVSGRLTEEWRGATPISESASSLKIRWLTERRNNFEKAQLEKVSLGIIKNPKKFIPPLSPDLETVEVIFPKEWEVVSVSEFAECLDSQRVPVKKDQRESANGLYPYFGANGEVDRVDDFIFDDDLVMVTEDETFYGRTKPIAYRYTGKCWVNNHAHVLRAPNKIANDFLCYTLMYYKVIPWLTGTTGRAKLGQGSLNVLPIGMPPEVEQIEIVRRVEQLFAYADQIEQRVKDAQARVNHLTQSILAKAFRGELTADWRAQNPELISGENSAAALLERIRVEREVVARPKRKFKA